MPELCTVLLMEEPARSRKYEQAKQALRRHVVSSEAKQSIRQLQSLFGCTTAEEALAAAIHAKLDQEFGLDGFGF